MRIVLQSPTIIESNFIFACILVFLFFIIFRNIISLSRVEKKGLFLSLIKLIRYNSFIINWNPFDEIFPFLATKRKICILWGFIIYHLYIVIKNFTLQLHYEVLFFNVNCKFTWHLHKTGNWVLREFPPRAVLFRKKKQKILMKKKKARRKE